jgi:serine/threonine-protein kinase
VRSQGAAPPRRSAPPGDDERGDLTAPPPSSFWSWLVSQDWLLAVALALFVAVLVWFGRSVRDFFSPNTHSITLPSLVGQSERDAMSEVSRLHLRADVAARETSDQYPLGVVMRQDPEAGAEVREGRHISLVVSSGIQLVAVPDLRYQTLREVGLDLSHLHLEAGKVRVVKTDEVPSGRVVAQDPLPLTNVRQGTAVNVDIAKGAPEVVTTPRLVGMDISDARDALARAKLPVGQVVWTPFGRDGPPRGVVMAQKPTPGTRIDPFERISLQVSAGPRFAGYVVRQVHTIVTVPDNTETVKRVRIVLRDGSGTSTIFDGYASPRQKLEFDITAVGSAQLDTYVDDAQVSSTTLGVEPNVPALPAEQVNPAPAAEPLAPQAKETRQP